MKTVFLRVNKLFCPRLYLFTFHYLPHPREILKNITALKKDVEFYCQSLCRAANQGSAKPMEKCLESLADKTRQLYQVLVRVFMPAVFDVYLSAHCGPESPIRCSDRSGAFISSIL